MIKKAIIFLLFLPFLSQRGIKTNFAEGSYSPHKKNYRQMMRKFVQDISNYSKKINKNFLIIPQNGCEIIEKDGNLDERYLSSIDGMGQEDLFYGFLEDNVPTPEEETNYILSFLEKARDAGKKILVIDYCWSKDYVDDSYNKNFSHNFISFAADHRELDDIPNYPKDPFNENNENINSLKEAKNFLYLINPQNFSKKEEFLNTLKDTDFDILIIDLFWNGEILKPEEVNSLKIKKNGGRRLVISYISIGEAENYRYYWKEEWNENPPYWLLEENPDWEGNYTVKFWYYEWQSIIFGNNNSYIKKILDSNFDGALLDKIDVFEYFEGKN